MLQEFLSSLVWFLLSVSESAGVCVMFLSNTELFTHFKCDFAGKIIAGCMHIFNLEVMQELIQVCRLFIAPAQLA